MNVLIVAADSETGLRLCEAASAAGFSSRPGTVADVTASDDCLALDGFAPSELGRLLQPLAPAGIRPFVVAGVEAEPDAMDAGLAAGVDEFYPAGYERSLIFRIRLQERRGAAAQRANELENRIEYANDVIYTIDLEGRFASANAAAERLTGYPRSSLIGMHFDQILLPESVGIARAQIRAKLEGQQSSSFYEVQIRRADGRLRTVEINSQLLFEDGKPAAIQGIARDLSERRLLEAEVRFRAGLLENLEAAAFATDLRGVVLYWNSASERMFGVSRSTAEGANIVDLVTPPDLAEAARSWLESLASGTPRQEATRLRRADGTEFEAQIATSPLRGPAGDVVAAVIVCLDQTEQRRQDARIREMAAIIDSAAVAVVARDEHARVTNWNAAAEQLLGYTSEEAIGRRMGRLTPERVAGETESMAALVASGSHVDYESVRVRKDGSEVPVRVTAYAVRDSEGRMTGTATFLHDLTEQRERERALHESEERFRAASESSLESFFILAALRDESGAIFEFRITDMNSAAERLVAMPRDSALGGLLTDLVPMARANGFFDACVSVAETGRPLDEERAVTTAGIRARWLHQSIVRLADGVAVTSRDITERRLQQEALSEARAQLRAIFESTSEAVLVFSKDFHLITANEAGLEGGKTIFGKVPAPGEDMRQWVHDSDWEHFLKHCNRAFAGERVTVQWPMPTIAGGEIWFEYKFNPVRDEAGDIYAVAMAARDISRARAMEAAIAEREAALTAVFQSMNESLVLMDVERRFILGNPLAISRTKRYTGREPVAGGSMELYVRPEHWRGLRHYHRRALAGEHCAIEMELPDPEGKAEWWEYQYLPVRGEGDDVVAVAMVTRDVTDRKIAEAALYEATRHYRAVVENTTDALFVLDVEGSPESPVYRAVLVNSAFERMTGFSFEMIAHRDLREVLPPRALPTALARYAEAIEARATITYEETVPFGDSLQILTTMTPLFDEDGRCYRIIGNSRDITEQTRLRNEERASREQAERLALIVESANDAVLSLDLDRRIVSWSPGAERMYGYSAAEVLGKHISIIHPEDPKRARLARERLDLVFSGSQFIDSPSARRHKDGHQVDILVSAFPLRNADGEIVGIGSTATDVTEQRRAEQALRDKAADLNAVFESSHDQFVLLDPAGQVISANPAAMASWAAAKTFDRPFGGLMREWIPEDHRSDFDARFALALSGTGCAFEQQITFAGETGWFDISYNPVRLEDGSIRGVVITSRNATERQRANEALMQAQKLESLAVLAGGIAHDFNNLLVGILGNAGLALRELSPTSPARPTIEAIETAGQRAAELARQMLAYSGKGRFLIQDVGLSALVEEMTHLLRVSIGKDITLQLHLGEHLPAVEADATQLRQVVMNLVVNASDAIGERAGMISLTTSTLDATKELLAGSYLAPDLPPGRYVSVEVTDTGSGMDAATMARIFDPFFTTKFTGRGLGLAAALGIMRSHRGAIKVESQPGQGTTFRLLLPALAAAAPAASPAQNAAWKGEGLVLIVDDEPTVRTVTSRALKAFGFDVLEAADGLEGVDVFRAHRSEIRCVLLDMTMPRMNGEETFIAIKQMDPDARIILMSGYTEQDATQRFSGRGLSGFIQKPYELATLRGMLKGALGDPEP